jgi:glucose/mannose-6-phosphate isomerase
LGLIPAGIFSQANSMDPITHEFALKNFHNQIRYVLDSYKAHGKSASSYSNVIIGGLGGSGIGGRIARLAFYTSFPIPIDVFSEYKLPAYAGPKTLVILSGGKITEQSIADGYFVYTSQTGYQPRMALGFSLTTLLLILGELSGKSIEPDLMYAEQALLNTERFEANAKEMMAAFRATVNHKFVVVCDLAFEAVAIRFCQQIQENAKGEAFISVLPEANHNMIESYYELQNTNFIFLNSGLNQRNNLRFDYLKSILEPKGNVIYHYPLSQFNIALIYEVIHTTDWLSIFVSNAKKTDNMKVEIISGLKDYLDNH